MKRLDKYQAQEGVLSAKPKSQIELIPLTEADVANRSLTESDIWYLLINEVPHGPYDVKDLQDYVISNDTFDSNTLACPQSDPNWKPLYDFPQFSRRKPQVISSQGEAPKSGELTDDLMTQLFFILKDGQPFGPLEQEDIEELISNKELLYTDQISSDEGGSWQKVHELEVFERRNFTDSNLPFLPDEKAFHGQTDRIFKLLNKKNENEALFSIAEIHNKHSGVSSNIDSSNESSEGSKKKINPVFIVILLSLGIAYFMYYLKTSSNVPAVNPPKKTATKNKSSKRKNVNKTVKKRSTVSSKLEKPRSRSKIRTSAERSNVSVEQYQPPKMKTKNRNGKKSKNRKPFEETSTYSEFHSQVDDNNPDKDLESSDQEELSENYDSEEQDKDRRPAESDEFDEDINYDDEGLLGEEKSEDEIEDISDNDIESEFEF